MKTIRNWSGLVRCHPQEYAEPRDVEELQRVLRHAAANGRTVRVIGSAHSFTRLIETGGTMVSLDGLQGMVDVDAAAREATVWAGTKLWRLNALLDEHGLAMENLGDINVQAIAGAVSTGTHGTGIDYGVLATQVAGLRLVTAAGEVLDCDETQNAEVFKAAAVSLGALGVIAQVRLRLVPGYKLRYVRRRETFEAAAARAAEYRRENRQFEFYFFPYTDTVQLKFLNETDAAVSHRGVMKWFEDVLLENAVFGAMSRACRMRPAWCPAVSRLAARLVTEGDEVGVGHRVLSTKRYVRFNEMEYSLPAENGIACVRAIKEFIVAKKIAVHFPIEFRYVKGDDIWLSPAHGRDTACISIHQYVGMPFDEYFRGAEAIFREHGGRPHWGKLHNLKAAELAPLYPRWEDFHAIRRRLDPEGLFLNAYLREMFGDAG